VEKSDKTDNKHRYGVVGNETLNANDKKPDFDIVITRETMEMAIEDIFGFVLNGEQEGDINNRVYRLFDFLFYNSEVNNKYGHPITNTMLFFDFAEYLRELCGGIPDDIVEYFGDYDYCDSEETFLNLLTLHLFVRDCYKEFDVTQYFD
jgi:hypothetical protein